MNISSLYDRFPMLGIVTDPTESELASDSSGGVGDNEKTSASATVSIRIAGEAADTTAAISVMGDDGMETNSKTAVSTSGNETKTVIDMSVLQWNDAVSTQTNANAEAEGDDAEASVAAQSETTVDDELVISSEGNAEASGSDPMGSIDITNSVENAEGAEQEVEGNVEAEASVGFGEDANAAAGTKIVVDPDLNIDFEDADDITKLDDDRLVAQSFEIVKASDGDVDEAGLPESITFADWSSFHDLW